MSDRGLAVKVLHESSTITDNQIVYVVERRLRIAIDVSNDTAEDRRVVR